MRKTPAGLGERGATAPLSQIARLIVAWHVLFLRRFYYMKASHRLRLRRSLSQFAYVAGEAVHLTTSQAICLTQIFKKKA